jgi:penicillin-binding protein-related factor A (putative recombinase)
VLKEEIPGNLFLMLLFVKLKEVFILSIVILLTITITLSEGKKSLKQERNRR